MNLAKLVTALLRHERIMDLSSAPGFGRRSFLSGVFAAAGGVSLGQETKLGPKPKEHGKALVYQFKIGELDAWSISGGHMLFRRPVDLMWPQEANPEMKDWLESHGERLAGIPLYVNILVVRIGKEVVIFDAGFGEGDSSNIGWLQDGLRQAGIAPEQVTAGFLSHSHADHLEGFLADIKPTFPNAAFYDPPKKYEFWHAAEPDFSKTKRTRAELSGMIRDVRKCFEILKGVLQPVKAGTQFLNGTVTRPRDFPNQVGQGIAAALRGSRALPWLHVSHSRGVNLAAITFVISLSGVIGVMAVFRRHVIQTDSIHPPPKPAVGYDISRTSHNPA